MSTNKFLPKIAILGIIGLIIALLCFSLIKKMLENTSELKNERPFTDTNTVSQKENSKNGNAQEVMKNFLDSDMKGERGGEGDEMMVVDSYSVINSDIKDDKASFTVKYKCAAGGYEFDADGKPVGVKSCASYFSENSNKEKTDNIIVDQKNNEETVEFILEKDNKGWKVISPAFPPHVSAEVFLNHTKALLGDSANMDVFNDFFYKK